MAKVELSYVQRFRDRHGKLRHYFRKPGCRRVPLPGLPGSKEFMAAYQEALCSRVAVGESQSRPGSMSALIAAYYESPEWKVLAPQTRRTSRLILDRFREQYGDGPANKLEPEHIRRILDKHDKPWAAKNLLKRLRGVFRFAVERKIVRRDPTQGLTVRTRKTDGFRAWTDGDIEKFEAAWPPGSKARLALYLLLYTGQRRSDVVGMGRQHVQGGSIHVRQRKTGASLVLPIHPTLHGELDLLPGGNMTFLVTAYGKPFSAVGFSNWFTECARKAGLPPNSSPHGLRKAAARRLAEAGCSAFEIAAVTGHASLKEVERYTRSAQQERLAVSAIAALQHTK